MSEADPTSDWRASLASQVVIVTGAGKGLGRAYAHWLAGYGAQVVVNNRRAPDGGSAALTVVDEIRAQGGIAIADTHSVEDEASCRELVAVAVAEFGRVDSVVCNAGMSKPIDVRAPDLATFRAVMDVNFWGSVTVALAALPGMLQRGSGHIVLTTSGAGFFGDEGSAFYGAAKSALLGFARSLALDVHDRGIRINLISPSAQTSMSARFDLAAEMGGALAPEHVAPVVGWLCSDACGRSGLVLHAGCGRVRRIMVLGGQAVDIPEGDVAACWPALDDMTGAREAGSSLDSGSVLRAGLGVLQSS